MKKSVSSSSGLSGELAESSDSDNAWLGILRAGCGLDVAGHVCRLLLELVLLALYSGSIVFFPLSASLSRWGRSVLNVSTINSESSDRDFNGSVEPAASQGSVQKILFKA